MIIERHWTPACAGVTQPQPQTSTQLPSSRRMPGSSAFTVAPVCVEVPETHLPSSRRTPGSSVVFFTAWLALLFSLCLSAPLAHATVLIQQTLEELVAASELIFIGEVTSTSTSAVGELVYTTVSFEVDEVVAGEVEGEIIKLRFLGGVSGEHSTEVSSQYIPAVGDRGLYFVDDTTRDLVNPLTGWSQGHFPLVDVDGTTWLDLKNHPDYGLLEPDADPLAGKMRNLNVPREEIAARFPERFRFPLADFTAVIADIRAQQAQ